MRQTTLEVCSDYVHPLLASLTGEMLLFLLKACVPEWTPFSCCILSDLIVASPELDGELLRRPIALIVPAPAATLPSMVDLALVFRVFLVACTSISKAGIIIAAGALLERRDVLTSDVRQGMSHMAAGLLVPCLPVLTRTPCNVRTGHMHRPPACCTHQRRSAACLGPHQLRACRTPDIPWHHRCLLFDRVSAHVTWAVLGQAWPILMLGVFLVTIGCAFGYMASRVAPLSGDLRRAAIAATAFANSQASR